MDVPEYEDALELKTLICAECGTKLRPESNTLTGAIVGDWISIRYTHPSKSGCSRENLVCKVKPKAVTVRYVAKEDWGTLPPQIIPLEPEITK